MFPSNGPLKRRLLPSTGSLGPVPPLPRYYEALRPPAARLAALRCLRLAIPPARLIRSQRPRRAAVGSGELMFRFPSRNCWWGRQGLPGSWATLVSLCPALGPRQDRGRQAIAAPRHGPRLCQQRRLPRRKGFGARSHGLGTGCLRFVLAVTRHDARLASGCLAQLGRAGFGYPQGCDERFLSSRLILLPQAFLALGLRLFSTTRYRAKMTAIPGSAAPGRQAVPGVASSIVPSS